MAGCAPWEGIPLYSYINAVYPPYREPVSWYFRVEHNLPNPLILQPGEQIEYEIRIYPLKAGEYHVHSFFISDEIWRFGRGQTIIVTGTNAPTVGEITQLYLPFTLGLAAFVGLMLKVIPIPKGQRGQKRARGERAVRVYFVVKSAF